MCLHILIYYVIAHPEINISTQKGEVVCLYSGECSEAPTNPDSLYLLQVQYLNEDGKKEPWIIDASEVDNAAGRYIQDAGDYDSDKAPVSIKTGFVNNVRFLNWVSSEQHEVVERYYTKVITTMDIPQGEVT